MEKAKLKLIIWLFRLARSYRPIFIFLILLVPSTCFANDLEQLVSDYKALDFPFAPPDSSLVRLKVDTVHSHTSFFVLAFQLSKDSFLVGPGELDTELHSYKITKILDIAKPNKVPLDNITNCLVTPMGGLNIGLATAIQCRQHGWTNLADRLFEMSRNSFNISPVDSDSSDQFIIKIKSPIGTELTPVKTKIIPTHQRLMADLAWTYWTSVYLENNNVNQQEILRKLDQITSLYPHFATNETKQILVGLQANVKALKNRSNSTIENYIDDLINFSEPIKCTDRARYLSDPRYLHLAEQGFKAVPELLKHWKDSRLTRSTAAWNLGPFGGLGAPPPSGMMRPRIITVGEVVQLLLAEMAGEKHNPPWAIDDVSERKITDWWNKYRNVDEGNYCIDHVVTPTKMVNRVLYLIISKRYPQYLPEAYHKLLKLPAQCCYGWSPEELIAESTMQKQEKVDLLQSGIESSNLIRSKPAYKALKNK